MTGKLLLKPAADASFEDRLSDGELINKHTHLVLELIDDLGEEEDLELHFNDVRTFGNIWVCPEVQDIDDVNVPGLRELGPDALGITLGEFTTAVKTKRNVKSVLLDQRKIAGVGNIYADEALFAAIEATVRVTPQRQVIRMPGNINDDTFVQTVVSAFLAIHPPLKKRA
jgi:formamidopyrimidine-DNA glycosylase